MSSSGLIYAVIVGAWAAYLVPMWLRRQDELNDSRPTERFSTAIRLLSGRAAMERRHARERAARENSPVLATDGDDIGDPGGAPDAPDVRAFADPASAVHPAPDPVTVSEAPTELHHRPEPAADDRGDRGKRAKVLARRRRTTMVLFLAFTLGAVIAAVGGLGFLWVPAIPAVLLSAYIVHLRAQERRRFAVRLDKRRAEAAARQLHDRRQRPAAGIAEPDPVVRAEEPAPPPATPSDDRRALVEQTDHAEWIDQQRERERAQREADGWEPVPVPLPTYVNAPVAPRTAPGVDLDASDAWSSARSTTADPTPTPAPTPRTPPRKTRHRGRTPLFDQYADQDRPRAANE
ncbi:gephyrin-like molybdotransferase receptor GlpR [Streptomyces gobiensis]|uniref:divisome protein SepX/GlpR n=1 Tax=Streptomyces gobiensis TaxID=2875706 RepID=UPI001E5C1973|nr:gephyrin-like molybdotransferase receptor GlpR [Streptomyces gobiensis]UGY91891.1 hypothetical protein test1122_09275 [Streptomyces gobiensis]